MNLRSVRFGGVKIALLSVVGAAALGYAGYRVFFQRPGEAAVALIPADAQLVVTLDSHPSEAQVGAFLKLSNALKREKVDGDIEEGISGLLGKSGIAKDVRQYLTNNMASAWWMAARGEQAHGIVLFSINNPAAVSKVLASGTPVPGALSPAYSFGTPTMVTSVVGDYLAVATDVDTILRVEQTQAGGNSVASLGEYRSARAALPNDANVMVFVAPTAFTQFMPNRTPTNSMWLSYGASLRDGGIQFDFRGPLDNKTFPGMSELSKMAPINRDLLKKLPPDAYGLMAFSSIDKYYAAARGGLAKATSEKDIQKGEADFEKEIGLSIASDVLPAFKGDVVLAVYPDAAGSTKSADGLLLIDNANGGNPSGLVEKVRGFVERKSAEEAAKSGKPAVHFVETKMGQTSIWRLDDASAIEMRKSMGGNQTSKPDPIFGDKNIQYAVNNGSLVVTTSNAMMTKALLVFNGDRTLADDLAFAEMATHIGDKEQMMFMCCLSRVAERFKDDMGSWMKGTDYSPDDLIGLFGGPNVGMVGSSRIESDSSTGTLFLPLDFDRLAKLIHLGKHAGRSKDIPAAEISPITK